MNKQNNGDRSMVHTTKEGQMFTEKCLEILSRKKVTKTSDKHRDKMRQMMDSIIEKYKSNL